MSSHDVARDVINRVLDRDPGPGPAQLQVGGYFPGQNGAGASPAVRSQNGGAFGYNTAQSAAALPVYTTPQQGTFPPPLYQQGAQNQAPYRGLQAEQMPSRGTETDYVNQAFSEALARARQKWNFNLIVSLIIAGMIILGVTVTGIWMLMGQANALTALFGTGATILGVLGWALARPAAQLNEADNQVSLLMMIWTKYTQDLQGCERITDATAAASCTAKVGDEAINHFNSIVGKQQQ